MKKYLSLLIVIAILISVALPVVQVHAASAYYVDPVNGNDNNNGTSTSTAFRTITKARDVVRTVNSNMTSDINVYLMNGTYNLTSTITFGVSDSGTNGYNVIYKAYTGAVPVISGGINLTGGWTLHDSSKNIYKKTGVTGSFRQLFVNNKWGTRARVPNLDDPTVGSGFYSAINTSYPFTINSSEIGSWANNGTTEMVWLAHWSQIRCRINNYIANGSSAMVYFKSPENSFAINHHNQSPGAGPGLGAPPYYYFENAYELLDAEGEWFLDTVGQNLYYKPRSGENMSTVSVIAPKVEKLISIEGTSSSSQAHNIQFYGITFMHDNWIAPNNYGYNSVQGGSILQTVAGSSTTDLDLPGQWSPTSGMLCIKNGSNIRVERNKFTQGGSWGIMEFSGSDHNTFVGNSFSYLASGAIALGNSPNPCGFYNMPTGTSSYDSITNNLVEDVAYYYKDSIAILGLNPKYTTIDYNELRNIPYSGISIGFHWGDTGVNDSHDNNVRYNRIHETNMLLPDGGGIYTLGKMQNTNISQNFTSNIIRWVKAPYDAVAGVYLDNGSCYKTVNSNVSDHGSESFYAYNPPNHDNYFINNYHNNSALGRMTTENSGLASNNTSYINSDWSDAAKTVMNNSGIQSAYSNIGNVGFGGVVSALKPSSASSQYSTDYSASKANDNNNELGLWASDATQTNPWWQVDLQSKYKISEVTIQSRVDGVDSTSSRQNFSILASNDPNFATYTTFASVSSTVAFQEKGVYKVYVNDTNTYRYIRIQRINNAGHFTFSECKVYGLPDLSEPTKISQGKSATATAYNSPGEGPSYAVDGVLNTHWCSTVVATTLAPQLLQIDLGATYNISRWVVKHAQANGQAAVFNTRDFKLQISSDGTNFTDVDTVTGNTASITDRNVVTIGRYVRLSISAGTQPGYDGFSRINEFEIYGLPSSATPTKISQGKTATASAYNSAGEAPAYAVDGTLNTHWCSTVVATATAPQWLKIDLGATYNISRWVVKHAQANGETAVYNTRDYKLQISSDGTNFTDVDTVTGNTASLTDRNAAANGRYVRLLITTGTQPGYDGFSRINEFEVYGY